MGSFFTNIQVFTGSEKKEETMACLIKAVNKILFQDKYIEAAEGDEPDRTIAIRLGGIEPWITVFDEAAEEQDLNILDSLAAGLSSAVETETISSVVHDSDVLRMCLYREGETIDTYINEPSYFDEALTREQRKAYKGQPELWEQFLSTGVTAKKLRQAWNSKEVFAEDILRKAADLLGFNREHCDLGYNYLKDFDLSGIIRLAFRLKERPVETSAQEGSVLRQGSFFEYVQRPVGQVKISDFGVINNGGEAQGLVVVVWGPAYDEGLIIPEHVVLSYKSGEEQIKLGQDLKSTTGINGENMLITSYPEYKLPAKKPNPKNKYIQDSFFLSITGTTVAVGESTLIIGVVAGVEPNKSVFVRTESLKIVPTYRRPLRYEAPKNTSLGQNNDHHLTTINGKKIIFSMIFLKNGDGLLISEFENWHNFLRIIKEGVYYPEIQVDMMGDTKHHRVQKAKGLIKTKVWQEISENLASYASINMPMFRSSWKEVQWGNRPFGGFEVMNGYKWQRFISKNESDKITTRIGFWVNSEGLDSQMIDLAFTELRNIVDEVAGRSSVLQAFMGCQSEWSYQEYKAYELLCGIEGECSEGKLWCSRFLRLVTETIWLSPSQLSHIDLDKISEVCSVEEVGNCTRLTLKAGKTLDDFEQLLAPILPSRTDWEEAMKKYRGEE